MPRAMACPLLRRDTQKQRLEINLHVTNSEYGDNYSSVQPFLFLDIAQRCISNIVSHIPLTNAEAQGRLAIYSVDHSL